MVTTRLCYSIDQLLQLRNKSCLCVSRTVRRRLFYHNIFIRHIPAVITPMVCGPRKSCGEYASSSYRSIPSSIIHCRPTVLRSSRHKSIYPSLILTNARSIGNKFVELSLLVSNHCPDLCVITESWLDSTVSDASISLFDYNIFRCDRISGSGGGIICYVRSTYSVQFLDVGPILLPLVPKSEFMCLFIKEMKLFVVIVYHPYWNNQAADDEAMFCITSLIDHAFIEYGSDIRIILTGDFNDLRNRYDNMCDLFSLRSIVNFPTRGNNTLDQVLVNFDSQIKPRALPPLGNSDHIVILWQSSTPVARSVIKKKVRKFSHVNFSKLSDHISSIDWLALINSCSSVDESADFFLGALFCLFDMCFPEKTVRIRANEPSWMKCSLKLLIDERDKAFHKRQWPKYNRLKDEVRKHVIHLKSVYLQEAIDSTDPKKLWKSLRVVARNSKPSTSIEISTDELCEYFSSNFQLCDPVSAVSNADSFDLPPITCDDVFKELRKLTKTSIGPDGIPPWLFREFSDLLTPAITSLFNWSLHDGIVPQCFKRANVCPVPKTDKPSSITDFRPISILPVVSKVFERLVSKKYVLPLIKDRVNPSQFAFIPRPGAGTTSALVLAQHHILRFLDTSSGAVRLMSVDLSKAFDKLPHPVIVSACQKFHLSPLIVKWVISFLSCRSQRVFYKNLFSKWCDVLSGVPQGSVLGPVLFALSVDEFSPSCSNTNLIKYADDFLFLHYVRNYVDDNLQNEWDHLVSWSSSVSLPINDSKCFTLDIVTKNGLSLSPVRVDSCDILNQVTSFSYLGVIFSSNMKWNDHINFVVKKASRRIFIIRNLRRAGCDPNTMFMCYVAFIRSVLLYAFPCFCNATDYVLNNLLRVERRVLKIIGTNLERDVDILQTADHSCRKLFKRIVESDVHPLRELFSLRPSCNYSIRRKCHLFPPRAKTRRFQKSFIKFCK